MAVVAELLLQGILILVKNRLHIYLQILYEVFFIEKLQIL
jgi:hypothetical protein